MIYTEMIRILFNSSCILSSIHELKSIPVICFQLHALSWQNGDKLIVLCLALMSGGRAMRPGFHERV